MLHPRNACARGATVCLPKRCFLRATARRLQSIPRDRIVMRSVRVSLVDGVALLRLINGSLRRTGRFWGTLHWLPETRNPTHNSRTRAQRQEV